MRVAFISNYYNHHQKSFSDSMDKLLDGQYSFIETTEMREERKKLGYELHNIPQYVKKIGVLRNRENEGAIKIINEADVIIIGSAPQNILSERKKFQGVIFNYSERLLKRGRELHKYFYRWIKLHNRNFLAENHYMLCASAYTAADYATFGMYKNYTYKWGYFPETKRYENIDAIINQKKKNSILWAGRMLSWKHPDDAIAIAKRLKEEGYIFELNFIGIGEKEEQLKEMAEQYNLSGEVHFFGAMRPEKVRTYMESSEIFLFTSDRQEGWGAVLNESMNSACAVVASHAIGAVPFLIEDGENGLIYESGNVEMLYKKVKYLLDHPDTRRKLGERAYQTIEKEWNAEVAAERFIELSQHILAGEKHPDLFKSGPCSRAEIIKDGWYKAINEEDKAVITKQ